MTETAPSYRPRRSCLYMPGSNSRALEKARSLDADVLILDLEDAVAPDSKSIARDQVAAAVAADSFDGREVVVRINGLIRLGAKMTWQPLSPHRPMRYWCPRS